MKLGKKSIDRLSFSSSARRDIRIWGMFIVGSVFVYGGLTIDPASNCNDAGECAPWLVPIAFVVGVVFALAGLARLIANPKRGSRIDPETGVLTWWQNRTVVQEGDSGSIDPADIGRIRIVKCDDSADQVHLYDRAGERQPYFDEEVIGDAERWAEAMKARWPNIVMEVNGRDAQENQSGSI